MQNHNKREIHVVCAQDDDPSQPLLPLQAFVDIYLAEEYLTKMSSKGLKAEIHPILFDESINRGKKD